MTNQEIAKFQSNVAQAWEQISSDAGEPDGCNAVDHLEGVFFHLESFYHDDKVMMKRIQGFDPELEELAEQELKSMGDQTNIWVVVPRGKDVGLGIPFVAADMNDVRAKAVEVGGKNYKFVFVVKPGHRHHHIYKARLGL